MTAPATVRPIRLRRHSQAAYRLAKRLYERGDILRLVVDALWFQLGERTGTETIAYWAYRGDWDKSRRITYRHRSLKAWVTRRANAERPAEEGPAVVARRCACGGIVDPRSGVAHQCGEGRGV